VAGVATPVGVLGASLAMPRRYVLCVAIGCAWLVDFALFYALLKTFTGAWYLYYALIGAALLIAASLEWSLLSVLARLSGGRARRLIGSAVLGGVLVSLVSTLWSSALLRPYPVWAIDGDLQARYLAAVADCARDAPDGAVLTFEQVPDYLEYADGAQTDLLVPTLVYEPTLTAALRLMQPERHFRLVVNSYTHVRSPGEHLAVTCTPDPSGRRIAATS
jgi:hypothetical protein